MPPLCVLLSHSVCSLELVGQYTWRAPSDNTINDAHEHPDCDWVSEVEIGPISCRSSLNLVALQVVPPHCSWSSSVAMLLKYKGLNREISASLNCGSLGIGDPSALLNYTPIKKRSIAHLLENYSSLIHQPHSLSVMFLELLCPVH